MEECSLAVGEMVGYEIVKSASTMKSVVVVFLDSTDKFNQLLESRIFIKGTLRYKKSDDLKCSPVTEE